MNTYSLTMTVKLDADNIDDARQQLYRWLDSTADLENLAMHAQAKRVSK